MERFNRKKLEDIFKDELAPYIKERVLEFYSTQHEPKNYKTGNAQLHGLNAKTDNKWLFKLMVMHKIAKKVSKFDYSIDIVIPMLYSYHADNLEYQIICLDAAKDFLNERFGTSLYVSIDT